MLSERIIQELQTSCESHASRVEDLINRLTDPSDSHAVRVTVNKYFRIVLARGGAHSMEVRLCLDDNDNIEYWFSNFRRNVIPEVNDLARRV